MMNQTEGVLLVNKPPGVLSFSLVKALRKLTGVKKIGHGGTLDPFATGVMILLIGRRFTKLADRFLLSDKEYLAKIKLGEETTTYDLDGEVTHTSTHIPSQNKIDEALTQFQGKIDQIPPMFSAKRVNGKRLYDLARKGETVERQPVQVTVETTLVSYNYPYLTLNISCSKGTYIRSIAHDLGQILNCGGHLVELSRTRCGKYLLENCMDGKLLFDDSHPKLPIQKSIE